MFSASVMCRWNTALFARPNIFTLVNPGWHLGSPRLACVYPGLIYLAPSGHLMGKIVIIGSVFIWVYPPYAVKYTTTYFSLPIRFLKSASKAWTSSPKYSRNSARRVAGSSQTSWPLSANIFK